MPSFFQIVANTPLWVWPLMAFVLWLGWQGLQRRTVPLWRPAILPLVSIGTSLSAILQSPQPGLAIAGWFVLVFGISIFVVRYALGVLFGVLPSLRVEPLWLCLSGGVGGAVAGIGVGWLANLLLRTRRSTLGAG